MQTESKKQYVLGGARECLKKRGKYSGRPGGELAKVIDSIMDTKRKSCTGTVHTLCISPKNGVRRPCDLIEIKQSIVGDCQSKSGHPTVRAAKIKNRAELLGKENLYVESLLSAISVGDYEVVREIVRGNTSPRREAVWVTGDNVYVSGVDMSWENFDIGDILLLPNVAILNSGYPHFACWKYAVRAGNDPKAYINSLEGIMYRLRGIKGAVLLRNSGEDISTSASQIQRSDRVQILKKGTSEYRAVVTEQLRPPLRNGEEIIFHRKGGTLRATADDTLRYIDFLVHAGRESARIDAKRYRRKLPDHVLQEIRHHAQARM